MEAQAKDAAKAFKNRFKGKAEKLFKEKKQPVEEDNQQDVDSFLHGPSDKLYMRPPSANNPSLPPNNIDSGGQWSTTTQSNHQPQYGPAAYQRRRGRKGLVVRFTEAQAEIIGEGGDESIVPVIDIGYRKRAKSQAAMRISDQNQRSAENWTPPPPPPPPPPYPSSDPEPSARGPPPLPLRTLSNQPYEVSPIVDTPTSPFPVDSQPAVQQARGPPVLPELKLVQSDFMSESGDEEAFMAKVKAEMRSAEGKALLQATSESSPFDQHFPRTESPLPMDDEVSPELEELHNNTLRNATVAAPVSDVPLLNEPKPPPIPAKEQMGPPKVPPVPAPTRDLTSSSSGSSHDIPPTSGSGHLHPSSSTIGLAHTSAEAVTHHSRPHSPAASLPPILEVGKSSSPFPTGSHMRSSPLPTPQATPELRDGQLRPMTGPAMNGSTHSLNLHDNTDAVGEEALQDFSRRSAHLYTLFRLSAESVKPLPKCSPQELVRIALWWFLKGRSSLETSIRERPSSLEAQQANASARQQAHADLAKALWIIENVTSQYPQRQTISTGPNTPMADLLSAQQMMMISLKKLAVSMKRNDFLPPDPDDAPLPQGVDNTIWIADDGNRSLVLGQRFASVLSLLESFSLGDSEHHFQYGRMFVEAVLLEETATQYYRCHVLLSILRSQREKGLTVTVASQDGLLNIGIQHDKSRGPTWKDVRWVNEGNHLEIKLSRGFVLRLHCQQQDYEALWNLYDLHNEIYAVLDARANEELIFDATVKIFQQFKLSDGESIPSAPLPNCYLRVFRKVLTEKSSSGPRKFHNGFRLGLCTNVKTKNVKGVDRTLLSTLPVQFGYLRGESGLPALLLKSSDEKSENNIVFTFEDPNQRTRLHTLLTGLFLTDAEEIVSETALKGFTVTNQKSYDAKCLKYLDWKSAKVINETDKEIRGNKTIKSEHLRVVLDFKAGTVTDRFNLDAGELKIRLDASAPNQLQILRPPQHDLTISVSESQVLKDLPTELADLLRIMGRYETSRIYTFPDVRQLHHFQTALTGFKVLFDGIAASFNISRRRMVVPIYKKWDASNTRVQLVERDGAVQLLAFFEDFSHGSCMNFLLKSTDVFESSGRSNKFSIKIVDAKFALPRMKDTVEPGIDHEFACMDAMDYPSEHDDITIVFDAETDRDRFAQVLPGQVKQASRLAGIRK